MNRTNILFSSTYTRTHTCTHTRTRHTHTLWHNNVIATLALYTPYPCSSFSLSLLWHYYFLITLQCSLSFSLYLPLPYSYQTKYTHSHPTFLKIYLFTVLPFSVTLPTIFIDYKQNMHMYSACSRFLKL